MENLKKETLINSIKKLEEIVRCAVCLDVLQLEMVQCVNGHLLCSKCKTDLKNCPSCSAEFSSHKPTKFFSQFVEALPQHCKYNCGKYLDTNDDHEKYCGYKVTACRVPECSWAVPGKDILGHIQEIHWPIMYQIIIHLSKPATMKRRFMLLCNPTNSVSFNFFMIDETFLWEKTVVDVKTKKFFKTFYCVPNGKPAGDWFVELKFKPEKESLTSYFACKFKLNLDPDVDDEENIMYIPWKCLSDSPSEDCMLEYVISITEK